MSHSPRLKTDAPNHEDVNTPTKKIKVIEVTNPRPDKVRSNKNVKQTPGKQWFNKIFTSMSKIMSLKIFLPTQNKDKGRKVKNLSKCACIKLHQYTLFSDYSGIMFVV